MTLRLSRSRSFFPSFNAGSVSIYSCSQESTAILATTKFPDRKKTAKRLSPCQITIINMSPNRSVSQGPPKKKAKGKKAKMESFGVVSYVRIAEWDDIEEDAQPSKKSGKDKDRMKAAELRHNRTFRKIEQDLKERNRRKQKNMKEEAEAPAVSSSLYVDKDRAIAVGAEQDLKGDILKHRGKLMSDQTNAMLEEFDINVLIEQAGHELRWGDPAKALSYLEKGIALRPESIDCLVLKGRCLIELNRFRDALSDVDIILIELNEKNNAKALTVKGDALYNLGNFEHALLNYHRAVKNATVKEKFELGKRLARTELAVCNAVGPTASQYFRHLERFLYKIPSNVMGLPWFQLKNVVDAETALRSNRIKDRKFLGDLASDKIYLENILTKLSTQTHLPKSCQNRVKDQAEDALKYLIERRDFWAQQNPDYPELPDDIPEEERRPPSWRSVMQKVMKRRRYRAEPSGGLGGDTNFSVNPYG